MGRRTGAWSAIVLALIAGAALAGLRWPRAGAWLSWVLGSMARPAGRSARSMQRPERGSE